MINIRVQANLVFTRWSATPTAEDVRDIAAAVRNARKISGRDVLYVSFHGAANPPKEARDEVVRLFPEIASNCRTLYLVLSESPFLASFQRTILGGMRLAARVAGIPTPALDKLRIVDSFTDVLVAEPAMGAIGGSLISMLRESKFIDYSDAA